MYLSDFTILFRMKQVLFFIFLILNGFVFSQTKIAFKIDQPKMLEIDVPELVGVDPGSAIDIGQFAEYSGGTQPLTFKWLVNDSLLTEQLSWLVTPTDSSFYKIILSDVNGCTATDSIRFSFIKTPTKDFADDIVKIYPNPARSVFYVDHPEGEFKIQMFSSTGKMVISRKEESGKPIICPEPGLYFVKVSTISQTQIFKLIII